MLLRLAALLHGLFYQCVLLLDSLRESLFFLLQLLDLFLQLPACVLQGVDLVHQRLHMAVLLANHAVQLILRAGQRLNILLQPQDLKAQSVVLFTQRRLGLFQMFLLFFGLIQLGAQLLKRFGHLLDEGVRVRAAGTQLLELLLDLLVFAVHLIAGLAGFVKAALQALVLRRVGDLVLLAGFDLRLHRRQLGLQLRCGLLQLGQLGLVRLDLLLQPFNLLPQRVDFLLAGKQAGRLGGRTAGHRAAGVDQLPVQRHDAKTVAKLPCNLDRRVDVLCDRNPAQQVCDNAAIALIAADQLVGPRHKALHPLDAVGGKALRLDDVQRQKGGTAGLGIF